MSLFLASRNLPFRRTTDNLGDVRNGNFLGTLELLAHYDPLLSDHLQKVSEKTGARMTHYLSPESQNEFIELCGKKGLGRNIEGKGENNLLFCDL